MIKEWRRVLVGALALVLAGLLSGCAMMVNGSMQRVSFESNPAGAKVVVDGQTGITPTTLYLSRNRTYSVSMELEGYKTGVAHIERGWSPWFCGSCLLLWGPFELLSLLNGSAYVLGPANISLTLERAGASPY